jgi:hypothetical protein
MSGRGMELGVGGMCRNEVANRWDREEKGWKWEGRECSTHILRYLLKNTND